MQHTNQLIVALQQASPQAAWARWRMRARAPASAVCTRTWQPTLRYAKLGRLHTMPAGKGPRSRLPPSSLKLTGADRPIKRGIGGAPRGNHLSRQHMVHLHVSQLWEAAAGLPRARKGAAQPQVLQHQLF